MKRDFTKKLVYAGMLTAAAGVLMAFEFSIPMMPPFYKIDFSDVPSLIAIFTMGPAAGAVVEIAKLLIKIMISGTNTMFVGEIANLLSVTFLVIPVWFIYDKGGRTLKSALLALSVSALLRTGVACFMNTYVTLPMYAAAMGLSVDEVVRAVSSFNPHIVDLRTFILLATIPFNLIKIGLNSAIGYLLYERLLKAHALKAVTVKKETA